MVEHHGEKPRSLDKNASGYRISYYSLRTSSSEDSKSLAMSSSDGKPPAVTSEANVNVQYLSLLFAGAMFKVKNEPTNLDCVVF